MESQAELDGPRLSTWGSQYVALMTCVFSQAGEVPEEGGSRPRCPLALTHVVGIQVIV